MHLRTFARADLARDLERLYHLDQVCFPPEIAYSRLELKHFLTHARCTCWIAQETEDDLAGFLILERSARRGRSAGHIVTLDVDPGHRRNGVGTLLMQAAEQQMQHEACAVLSLEVAENNREARHFYNRLGFQLVGRIANYYGGRVNAEILEKSIRAEGLERSL